MSKLGTFKLRMQRYIVDRFMSYDTVALSACLRTLGIVSGDVVMVHASLGPLSGFTGRPAEMIQVLRDALGTDGLLVMPSMTYTDSSKSFLLRQDVMDVRRSPSRMGLLSEVFRRGRDVSRSLSPTHPLLAWGSRATEFVAGHERTSRPFGPDSPFQRLLDLDGKILCINTVAETITFTHFLEDRLQPDLPFELYEPTLYTGRVIDQAGATLEIPTRVLSDESRAWRYEAPLWSAARRHQVLRRRRIGNTRIMTIGCRDLTRLVDELYRAGGSLFVAA